MKTQSVVLLTAKEKLPFQITPFMLHLTRNDKNTTPPSATLNALPAAAGTATAASARP
jgi:hypothetical protein